MDIGPEEHFYGKTSPNRSWRGFLAIIAVLLIIGSILLWVSVYNDYKFYVANMTFTYVKALLGSFCLLFGIAGISSIIRN